MTTMSTVIISTTTKVSWIGLFSDELKILIFDVIIILLFTRTDIS